MDLIKDCGGVSEEWGLLLVPFSEGPFGALQTMFGLAEMSPKPIDHLLPMYFDRPDDYSIISQLAASASTAIDEWLRKGIPVGVWWEGLRGEPIVNSSRFVRKLAGFSGRSAERQLFTSVRIVAKVLPALQRVKDWPKQVDLGWKVDSDAEGGRFDHEKYPLTLDSGDLDEMTKMPGALLRRLLSNNDGSLDSPLRSTEVLRALVVRFVHRNFGRKIRRLDVYRFVDEYAAFCEQLGLPQNHRNQVVSEMLDSLSVAHILDVRQQKERRDDEFAKGQSWENWSPLLACYTDETIDLGVRK